MSDLKNKIKELYEDKTRIYLPLKSYTIIRIDGKAFHSFTKDFNFPFDEDFIKMMNETAQKLCKQIQGVKLAYVQSDEISLILTDFDKENTNLWFDGNIQKIVSVSASIATQVFNFGYLKQIVLKNASDQNIKIQILADCINQANFDSRVFSIPSYNETYEYLLLRQKDAIKNSISMVAQSLYSHQDLNGKNSQQKKEMIVKKGIDWNKYPLGQQQGRVVVKDIVSKKKFNKKINKTETVERSNCIIKDAPLFFETEGQMFVGKVIPQK